MSSSAWGLPAGERRNAGSHWRVVPLDTGSQAITPSVAGTRRATLHRAIAAALRLDTPGRPGPNVALARTRRRGVGKLKDVSGRCGVVWILLETIPTAWPEILLAPPQENGLQGGRGRYSAPEPVVRPEPWVPGRSASPGHPGVYRRDGGGHIRFPASVTSSVRFRPARSASWRWFSECMISAKRT